MKKQRFIITEIYSQDLHAVNKVLVDTKTHVQYLLHQEGASSSMVCLVDEKGQPLLSDTLDELKVEKEKKVEEYDQINYRKEDEEIEKFPQVEING